MTPTGFELIAASACENSKLGNPPSGSAAKSGAASAKSAPADLDLARVLDAWPRLPPHIRAAVLALVGAAGA
jgi:hypothetical protein